MIENRTAYALLGFLTWRPMSGYELKQAIARSVGNFWSEGYGQIYPMLQRLADQGLIVRHPAKGTGSRIRRVYKITARGRAALHGWLLAPVNERPTRVELLLKLFFGDEMPLSASLTHVKAARASAADKLAHYQSIAEDLQQRYKSDPRMPFWLLTVDYGLEVMRARLAWCDRALGELNRLAEAGQETSDTEKETATQAVANK